MAPKIIFTTVLKRVGGGRRKLNLGDILYCYMEHLKKVNFGSLGSPVLP